MWKGSVALAGLHFGKSMLTSHVVVMVTVKHVDITSAGLRVLLMRKKEGKRRDA